MEEQNNISAFYISRKRQMYVGFVNNIKIYEQLVKLALRLQTIISLSTLFGLR